MKTPRRMCSPGSTFGAGGVGVRATGGAAAEVQRIVGRRRCRGRVLVDVGLRQPHRALPAAGRGRDRRDRGSRRVAGVRPHRVESFCRPGDSVRRAGGRPSCRWWRGRAAARTGGGPWRSAYSAWDCSAAARWRPTATRTSTWRRACWWRPCHSRGCGGAAVPLPQGYGSLGAPQAAGAAAVVLLLTLATRGGREKEPSCRRSSRSLRSRRPQQHSVRLRVAVLGAGWWIAFGLIIVTNAAKLTVAVARIALPRSPRPARLWAARNFSTRSPRPSAMNRRPGRRYRVRAGLRCAAART